METHKWTRKTLYTYAYAYNDPGFAGGVGFPGGGDGVGGPSQGAHAALAPMPGSSNTQASNSRLVMSGFRVRG
jgi:hypothetical protein